MKRIAQVITLGAILIILSACSGNGISVSGGEKTPQTGSMGMTAGNWYFSAISSRSEIESRFSGPLTVSGDTISIATTPNSTCIPFMPLVFSGKVSDNSVTIASPSVQGDGRVMTMTGTSRYGSNFDGVYQITGTTSSDKCYNDSGTVFGIQVLPLDGSWSGILVESAYDQYGNVVYDLYGTPVKNTAYTYATIAQATAPVTINSAGLGTVSAYPLSGSLTFRGSPCYSSGTIDSTKSYIVGSSYNLVVITDTGGALISSGNLDPARPILMNFSYTVPGGACAYYQVAGTLQTPAIDYGLIP